MKSLNALLLIMLAFCVGCGESTTPSAEQAQASSVPPQTVKENFTELRHAIENVHGETGVQLVTASTLDHYENCRKLALDSSSTDFDNLEPMTIMLTFQLRYLLSKAELEEMTGEDIFKWGINGGLVDKRTLSSIEIHKVQYDGNTALATVTVNNEVSQGELLKFLYENGLWKLDMMEISKPVNAQLDEARKKAGKTKTELAIFMLEKTYGESIPPAILDGPLK